MVFSSPKKTKQLLRAAPDRKINPALLIVCEGTETEIRYLNELKRENRLSHVYIFSGEGTDPLSVVNTAYRKYREELKKVKYHHVYCVFDRDKHLNFEAASLKAKEYGFVLIRSWPCVEFWFLLHFGYVRSPFIETERSSSGDLCEKELTKRFKEKFGINYSKRMNGLFLRLLDLLDEAKKNAIKAREDAKQTGEDNPSTEFHMLVDNLLQLKNK